MEPTLGQIKEYIRVHNIKLPQMETEISENSDVQLYGNNENAEEYFQYYLDHSVEIHDWLNNTEKEEQNKIGMKK